jgi:hypothetical protein
MSSVEELLWERRSLKFSSKVETEINPEAYEVIDLIVEAYKNKWPPYDTATSTQGIKPDSMQPNGEQYHTSQHAMFFWNACAYMQATNSESAFYGLTDLYDQHPELFDCRSLLQQNPSELAELLRNTVGHGRQNSIAETWRNNAFKLHFLHQGDPRDVLMGAKSYDDCLARLANDHRGGGFEGFQPKMVSMLLYFLQDEDMLPSGDDPDAIRFPIPVDFHAMRVAFATELIKTGDLDDGIDGFHRQGDGNSLFEQQIRELLYGYSEQRQIDPVDLTNAIWLLSSNLCNQTPGNRSRVFDSEAGREFAFLVPYHESMQHSRDWFNSCGRCAVKNYCRFYVPSAPYYRNGGIVLRPKHESDEDFVEQQSLF